MTAQPFIVALTATYGRPKLLANTIACFLAQDYPEDRRRLLALDDLGQYRAVAKGPWHLLSSDLRSASMPEKYDLMWAMARERWPQLDAVAIWDDDDIYLPDHLSTHAKYLQSWGWSYPQEIMVSDGQRLTVEPVNGNHWASCAFSAEYLRKTDGWPKTKRAAWDHAVLDSMARIGRPGRPAKRTFIFRWGSTGGPHLQWYIKGPDDETAYSQMQPHDANPVAELVPEFDAETLRWREYLNFGRKPEHANSPP